MLQKDLIHSWGNQNSPHLSLQLVLFNCQNGLRSRVGSDRS